MATTEAPASKADQKAAKRHEDNIARAQELGYDIDPNNCDPLVVEAGTRKIGAMIEDLLELDRDACDAVFSAAKVDPRTDMTADQYDRAVNRAKMGGLRGKALATWIITGDSRTGAASSAKERRTARETRTATARKTGAARKAATARKATASTSATTTTAGPREGSGLWAALQVLKAARNPLTPDEIWDRIKAKKLAPGMKGKTPAATIGAQLAVALKAKKIPGLTRPEPGRYAIKKGGK